MEESVHGEAIMEKKSELWRKMAMAIFCAGLLATSLFFLFSHGFPALHFLALHRLKDLPIFLLFTTAIVVAILHSLRPQALQSSKPGLDQFPLASIFGDIGSLDAESYHASLSSRGGVEEFGRQRRGNDASMASPQGYSSLRGAKNVAGSDETTPTHRRNLSASKEEGHRLAGEAAAVVTQMKKLNRRSSSLDDSINYEPAEAEESTRAEENSDINAASKDGSDRSVATPKKVSFSVDSWGAASPEYERKVQGNEGFSTSSPSPGGQGSMGKVLMSPNEVNRQADAFIAKFKEQIRLQKLESFQRYRRRPL